MLAEDAVHDVFEAVLSGRAAFAGRSALRSWLTAIQKNKIVDLVRQRAGTDSLDLENEDEGALAISCPRPQPDEVDEQRELLTIALQRIDALPAPLRDVMQLRVLQDEPTEQVCAALAISEDNLFVRLHRARKQLMSCNKINNRPARFRSTALQATSRHAAVCPTPGAERFQTRATTENLLPRRRSATRAAPCFVPVP